MNKQMTPIQLAIWNSILMFRTLGLKVNYAMIGKEFGITQQAVHAQVNTLVRKGFLRRAPHTQNTLMVVHPDIQVCGIVRKSKGVKGANR